MLAPGQLEIPSQEIARHAARYLPQSSLAVKGRSIRSWIQSRPVGRR